MAKFQDSQGREWTLFITVAAMRRARSLDVDLSMPVGNLRAFLMDDVFISDALWSIVSPAAKERGIDQEAFELGLNGPVFDQARESLWEALTEFYDPKSQRSQMLRAAIEEVARETAIAITRLSSAPRAS